MSRVGRLPVEIPDGVTVTVDGSQVAVEGPEGSLSQTFDPDMMIEVEDGKVVVRRPTDRSRHRSLHGLTRSLIYNMVQGVTEPFERSLEIHGVGYRARKQGRNLMLNVGFSHQVEFEAPEGIDIDVENPTLIHVRGADKQLVGQVAAEIRLIRPPEPYKGKGIRYVGEQVRRKAGKATVSATLTQ